MPATRPHYWGPKLARNIERDERAISELRRLGWDVLIVWECWLKDANRTSTVLKAFLGGFGKVRDDG